MSSFTHSICYDCWDNKNPDKKAPRNPLISIDLAEKCCFCGERHCTGIFVREKPELTRCKGKCDNG
jgi:hypothetical protein